MKVLGALAACVVILTVAAPEPRVAVVVVTDLYHPPQDPGDNFDLLAAFALPEVDLRAVILDCTEGFRKPVSDHPGMWKDSGGPREPGVVPVTQLNYIFNRNVPFAVGPMAMMKGPGDRMLDRPGFEQGGIELLLETLRKSSGPVHVLSFGSARAVAAAYNRDPGLFKSRLAALHLSAGAESREFLEWNVQLDPQAIVALLRSPLPVAIYPCATKDGPFSKGRHNTYWKLPDLKFVGKMEPRLRRYLAYAFWRSARPDFLRAMDEDGPGDFESGVWAKPHNVWETAVWGMVAGRRLVRQAEGSHRLVPAKEGSVAESLRPCLVTVADDGRYRFELTDRPTNFRVYERTDPEAVERAGIEALPALYLSFKP